MRMSGWPGWPPRATPSTHAGVAHIGALCQAVDLTHVGTIHDPWAGQGMHNVQEVLSYDQGMHVLTNGARMGQAARLHPLHPRTYDTMGTCDAIITCPWGEWADVALPMAILYASMVACVLVPCTYMHAMPTPRKLFLSKLREAGRLLILNQLQPAVSGHMNVWVLVFVDKATRTLMTGARAF